MKHKMIHLQWVLIALLIASFVMNLAFAKQEDLKPDTYEGLTSGVDLIQFSIIGDAPYDTLGSTALLEKFQSHIDVNNERSYAEFLIHVGDIKKGSTPCDLSYYANTLKVLESSKKIPYLLIGDNEWNDCGSGTDPSIGMTHWNNTFTDLNLRFKKELYVNEQSGRPENISFIRNSVLFILINQVDGRIHDTQEWQQRMADNRDWVYECMSRYKGLAKAYVIIAHAAPGIKRERQEIGDSLFYLPFRDSIRTFTEPILYIQGNKHIWNYDTNYFAEFQPDNFLRVVIDEDKRTQSLLQIVVSSDKNQPFYFNRNHILDSLTVDPTVTFIDKSTVSIAWQTNRPTTSVVRYGIRNGPLKCRKVDLINKTKHQITITDLMDVSEYQFEVGTRTSRLSGMLKPPN